ncbi:hypothetical protein KP509_06G023300 [Ceratopteris richardii]|uniref:Uncharacterized protein n=1 Tax=Ceratopteris richardii TaxID=49495 RepID=A0A8T2UQT9_CERRI|nr:hypothetical protein KP509_06G023300 [Ceratopteris richardii]
MGFPFAEFFKGKYGKLKQRRSYKLVSPTNSMRVEARSKLAQKLIAETLKAADAPGKVALPS